LSPFFPLFRACSSSARETLLLVESKSSALILEKMQLPERLKEQAEGTVETHIGEHTASGWAVPQQCRFELSSSWQSILHKKVARNS